MNGFLIFLAVALWFGLSIRKAYRKQMSELESETASSEGTVKNAFESLFDDAREEVETEGSPMFANEAASAGYYSYEGTTSKAKSRKSVNSTMSAPTARIVDMSVSEQRDTGSTVFDLRQAVIYQTILDNKYLSDTLSYDIR